MTTTLNATTSNGLVVTPDNSGSIQLQYNGVAAPTFSAYPTSDQSVTTGSWQIVQLAAKYFDTNTNFSTSTYRFTPTVAGYYQINGKATLYGSGTSGGCQMAITVNSAARYSGNRLPCVSSQDLGMVAANIVYLNGSTDYVTLQVYNFSNTTLSIDQNNTYMSGCLLRS